MKDFFGRPLKHNDLVVSKSTGRYAKMMAGLIRDEYKNVWFGRGSHGGAEMVLIDTTNDPKLLKIQIGMIADREKEIIDRKLTKQKKMATRIKKNDFKRFGVYSTVNNGWATEIYLGDCMIEGDVIPNVWMHVSKIEYDGKFTRINTKIEFWMCGRGYYDNRFYLQTYRSVKYPQKFIENFVLTKEEMHNVIRDSASRLAIMWKNGSNFSRKECFIQPLWSK